ncbi:hypothetical protein ABZO31_12480 [Streptomyces sp. HUAS MG47]|uniref:hypothetical protein n=1 Tax=Streptomyces solicamelliae TaxID=3231716 RepID=UPI003877E658
MDDRGIGALIDEASADAVVLDRVAYGAGATRWFVCRTAGEYTGVRGAFGARDCVSVYLDGRIGRVAYGPSVRAEILRIAARDRDCVVGVLRDGSCVLEVEYIAGEAELDEFEESLGRAAEVYVGAFPGRDDDGVRAVTFVVPDPDGTVRAAPH